MTDRELLDLIDVHTAAVMMQCRCKDLLSRAGAQDVIDKNANFIVAVRCRIEAEILGKKDPKSNPADGIQGQWTRYPPRSAGRWVKDFPLQAGYYWWRSGTWAGRTVYYDGSASRGVYLASRPNSVDPASAEFTDSLWWAEDGQHVTPLTPPPDNPKESS